MTKNLVLPESELTESFARSPGPGGQAVNKQETKVDLRFAPARSGALTERDRSWLLERLASRLNAEGELIVTSSKTRDQSRNREDARAKLAEVLRRALERPKPRRATKPSAGAKRRRLAAKSARGEVKKQRRATTEDNA